MGTGDGFLTKLDIFLLLPVSSPLGGVICCPPASPSVPIGDLTACEISFI